MQAPVALRAVEREARIYRRLWRGNLFSWFVAPSIFLLAMGVGLGGIIDDRQTDVAGLSYLEFVASGLLAATVVQLAAADSLWPVMAGTKWIRHYHAMVSTPLGPGDVLIGHLGWLAVRMFISAAAFLVVAALLGAIPSPMAPLALPAVVLTGLALAAPVAAFAAGQESESTFPLVIRFLVLPLFLFSGTFFPVEELPVAVRPVSWISPLWHGVELSRSATTGTLPAGGLVLVAVHVAVLLAYLTLGVRWGRRTFAAVLVS
jgi:lipooligosaccharide transport system permease protein